MLNKKYILTLSMLTLIGETCLRGENSITDKLDSLKTTVFIYGAGQGVKKVLEEFDHNKAAKVVTFATETAAEIFGASQVQRILKNRNQTQNTIETQQSDSDKDYNTDDAKFIGAEVAVHAAVPTVKWLVHTQFVTSKTEWLAEKTHYDGSRVQKMVN